MGDRVFLPLPDTENDVEPHPDGRPWPKACDVCAYRLKSAMPEHARYRAPASVPDGAHFYCAHRRDGEFDRICACYAALHRDRAAAPIPDQVGGDRGDL